MSAREPKPITLRTLQALTRRAGDNSALYWAVQIMIDVLLGLDIEPDVQRVRDSLQRRAMRS